MHCPDWGLFIQYQAGRKWSHIIARDSREVYVKRVANKALADCGRQIPYPQGIAVAAGHFLNPTLGIATVTADAQLILEEIMKTYSTKAAAKKGFIRMGGDVTNFEASVEQVGDDWQVDDSQLPTEPPATAPAPVSKRISVIANISKKRGNFRLICAAIEQGADTPAAIAAALPDITIAYIKQAILWGVKHGVFSNA
jgi:hypothetical protein